MEKYILRHNFRHAKTFSKKCHKREAIDIQLDIQHFPLAVCIHFYYQHFQLGGRAYPVRHYPVAIRLRDRKGRAILCSHYFLSVGTLRVLHSECVPSHSFTVVSRLSVGGIGQDIREVKELAIFVLY